MKELQPTARPKNDPVVRRATKIRSLLEKEYPDAHCALEFRNAYELLVATILSAQCTDVLVNKITPALFQLYPDAHAMAQADQNEVERLIQSTGFFRNKAKNLIACCKEIVASHGGEVPGSLEALVPLPGVGRKTANVVLGNAFGVPGITVDTHVGRLSRRLGFSGQEDPVRVEADLMGLIPKEEWTMFCHRMIWHGRRVCSARKPACESCTLASECPKIGVDGPAEAE